ncbi:MAG: potassium channel family protein [bacterium]|nr:potassium channel family protein [bacterium]
MFSFILILVRLGGAIWRGLKDPEFRALLTVFIVLLAVSTTFYVRNEGWRPLDALYFSVTTLATVGFGDFVPRTDAGKAFTIIFLLVGVGVFVALVARLAVAVVRPTQPSTAPAEDGAEAGRPRNQIH